MSFCVTVSSSGFRQRLRMSSQNCSSTSTAVTLNPVDTKSSVRFPQPGPNSTIRAGGVSPRSALADAAHQVSAGNKIAADDSRRSRFKWKWSNCSRVRDRTARLRWQLSILSDRKLSGRGSTSNLGIHSRTDLAAGFQAIRAGIPAIRIVRHPLTMRKVEPPWTISRQVKRVGWSEFQDAPTNPSPCLGLELAAHRRESGRAG